MSIRVYHNNRCTKSRGACQLLEAKGLQAEIREYLKNPPDAKELKQLLKMLGMKAEELIRKGEPVFKERYAGKQLSEEEWIKAMVEHPILIERPIVVNTETGKAIVARPPEKIEEFLK